jgi:hypothetical protein
MNTCMCGWVTGDIDAFTAHTIANRCGFAELDNLPNEVRDSL